jgi:hypothetical protein
LADYALQNTQDFVDYRFISPTKAIIDDLFLNKRNRLTDPGAIEDAKESLRKVSALDFYPSYIERMKKSQNKKGKEHKHSGRRNIFLLHPFL